MIARLSPLALVLAVGILGCSQEQERAVVPAASAASAPHAAHVVQPAVKAAVAAVAEGAGGLSGTVVWKDNPPPVMMPLNLGASADKAVCEKKGPVMDESAVVNPKNKGLRDVIIWLEPAVKGEKFTIPANLAKPAVAKVPLDQPNCAFIPHALVIREGQLLVAKNSSTIAHNFKWQGIADGNAGNKLLPPGGEVEIELKAEKLPISIECNIHPWMKGYVKVIDHPYYAVTDADGKFTIPNPPAGACKLKIWHGSKGWLNGREGAKGKDITASGAAQDLGTFQY
ncbi:MAG TPA: hypothetical protein VHR72_08240 [Gemmataceae bacterium]|jgi:hypothetical protein|nr:hypothetical protein [Gemmataceae bacterium]